MLIEEYDETKVHNLFKAEGEQLGVKKREQNSVYILNRLIAGVTVESLVEEGYSAETAKSISESLQNLQPTH